MYTAFQTPIFVAKTICDKAGFFLREGKIKQNSAVVFYYNRKTGCAADSSQKAKDVLS
ncbi:MAG: hypothetical protein H6Q17_337 [Bacteroidetes bacterium]|jgi:hypothetical protein|nr:hypothetical protein [Bacteroidota bacterium]